MAGGIARRCRLREAAEFGNRTESALEDVCIAEWAWLDRRVTSSESWIPGHLSLRSCEEKETTMTIVNEEVALPGATLSTYRSGQGAPLVLLHGGPGGEFAPLARVASMIDDVAEVFGYDQRASGRSTGEGPFTVATWLEDLQGFASALGSRKLDRGRSLVRCGTRARLRRPLSIAIHGSHIHVLSSRPDGQL